MRWPLRIRAVGRLLVLGVVLAIGVSLAPTSSVHPTNYALVQMQRASTVDVNPDVIWLLAVGSDARPHEDMMRTRGDALHLIGINSKTGSAVDIGIPRDSWVSIPGVGSNRINAALYYGGADLMGRTVSQLFDIELDYVFVTRFNHFQELIRSIGGVEVDNPFAFSDSSLKPKGFEAGRIRLGPWDALSYARIRKALLRGDFDRSANQSRVIKGIQQAVREKSTRPGWLEDKLLNSMQYMATDASPAEVYRLARVVAAVRPGKITSCVLQGSIGNVGGASVVLPYVAQAKEMAAEARDDATLKSCPGS